MKPGQVIQRWFQRYVLGEFRSPQDIYRTARAENPDAALSSDRFFGVPPDVDRWDAPARLAAPSLFTAESYLSQGHRADWQHVDLRLMRWSALFIEYARKRGIPLYVHSAFRTEAEQAALVQRGVSRAAYPFSPHNIGNAVDIVHSAFHWELSPKEWQLLHLLGLLALDRINASLPAKLRLDAFGNPIPMSDKLLLTWGGSFKRLYDPAHWEITDFRSRIERLSVGLPIRSTPRAILAKVKF